MLFARCCKNNPMKNKLTSFRFVLVCYCLIGLLGISLALLGLASGFSVDTNLKSLSPALSSNVQVSNALDKFANMAESKIVLVLSAPDEDALDNALYRAQELVEERLSHVEILDQSEALQSKLQALLPYRYFLLSDSAQSILADQSDEQIIDRAHRNLHTMGASFYSLRDDPFAYLQDYSLEAMASIRVQDELVYENGRVYSSLVLQSKSKALEMSAQSNILSDINLLKSELLAQQTELEFLHSGIVFFSEEASRSAKRDISLISAGSMLGTILLLLFVFRSLKPLLLPVVSIVCGIGFAFVLSHFVFHSVHILTIVFGASLIGVVIDYALHYFYFRVDRPNESQCRIVRALALSLLTSVVGYAALAISGLAALQQIAFFSVAGLLFSWLTVLVLGQYLTQSSLRLHDRFLQRLVRLQLILLSKFPSRLPSFLFLLVFICFIFLLQTGFSFNDSVRAFFKPSVGLLKEEAKVSQLFSSYEPASFVLVEGKSIDDVYARIESVRGLPEAKALLGVDNFVPSPTVQKHNYSLYERIYGEANLAERFLAQLGVSEADLQVLQEQYRQADQSTMSPSSLFVEDGVLPPLWYEADAHYYSFMMIEKGVDIESLKRGLQNIDGAVYLSSVQEASRSISELRERAMLMLLSAFVFIGILMIVRYRQISAWALVAVPGCSVMVCMLVFHQLKIEITLFHTMALFLVLGLGMDYVIFVREIDDHIERTLTAIVLSAITSLLSFGLLSLSGLPVVSAFGFTVLVGNSVNLLACLLLARHLSEKSQNARLYS